MHEPIKAPDIRKFWAGERIIRFCWKNVWLHRLRSLLTILGIVFGVASVIAMLSIGEGASYEARQRIKELGSTNIILRSVRPPGTSSGQAAHMDVYGLTDRDLHLIHSLPSVEMVVPAWEMKQNVRRQEREIMGRLVAVDPVFANVSTVRLAEGRFFNSVDMINARPVAVIGEGVRKALFPAGDAMDQLITVLGNPFRVIGVTESRSFQGAGGTAGEETTADDIYIPYKTGHSYFGERRMQRRGGSWDNQWVKYHRFVVKVKDMEKVFPTSEIIKDILKGHKKQDYEMLVPLELLRQAEHTKKIFNIVLGSIAAISLLVGGIGIMNIMLATVTERTKEIGIRRALGAKRSDIINQFLTEAIILSGAGGLIGVFLGVSIPKIVTKFSGMVTLTTLWSILIAFLISVAIGVVFGLYPARQAAYLDPIQALRHE